MLSYVASVVLLSETEYEERELAMLRDAAS